MKITIDVPSRAQILESGVPVGTAGVGQSWLRSQLGPTSLCSGVYVHHSNGQILYVGKTTTGKYGTFGERLRREFHHKASSNSPLHKLLVAQSAQILVYCLDYAALERLVTTSGLSLAPKYKALIMEQALIGAFSPPGNRAK